LTEEPSPSERTPKERSSETLRVKPAPGERLSEEVLPTRPAPKERPAAELSPAERTPKERSSETLPVKPAPGERPPAESTPTEVLPATPAAPPVEVESEKTRPVPEGTESPLPESEEGAQKESLPDLLKPPRAPEDAVKPPPPPKKEILKQKSAPSLPVLMKAPRSKEERKSMTVGRAETDEMADPRGWIKLDERRDPEAIPPLETEPAPETPLQPEVVPGQEPQAIPETQPVPEPRLQTPPQPETLPPPEPEPQPERQPVVTPEPEPEQQPTVEPEPQPMVPPEPAPSKPPETEPMPVPEPSPLDSSPKELLPSEPDVEPPGGKETLPSVQEPPPVREVFPSPLQDDVLESREVREYLKRAAPILEELSLLMARAPSLTIADYDPSDPNAPSVPGDVHPKMDSMKRTLQILDSKAFEIIPPKKYIPFHGLIRESIAETYKACDAITEYLDSNKPEDLRGVQDHLLKARELIRQTRERTQRG